jgi:DNA-binding MarR family transcriptional regulator
MRLLWSVEHRLQSSSKLMASSLGITGPQRLVLRIVGQFPGLSAKELARIVHLHPSTITGILQRLVEKGLLERKGDPRDRRRIRLRIRQRARQFTERRNGTVEAAVDQALSQLPRAHVQRAREVLWAIADALETVRD